MARILSIQIDLDAMSEDGTSATPLQVSTLLASAAHLMMPGQVINGRPLWSPSGTQVGVVRVIPQGESPIQ